MNNNYLTDARRREADLTAFMQDIIRIPSLSSQEGNVIARIREEMEKLGYDEVTVDPMGNLIGRIGSGSRIIALDGHVDIVDVGDPALWDRDPFSADIEDGVLYGRGASDMKAGVASSVYAGAMIRERGITLELCPTSNLNSRVVSGWDEFAWIFRTFQKNGVRYTINTDGPEMLKTYIRDEMASLARHGILSVEQQEQAAAWARESSFVDGANEVPRPRRTPASRRQIEREEA